MKSVWNTVKAAIKKEIPRHSYQMWIEPIKLHQAREGQLILACPNVFSKKRVQDHYSPIIESELKGILGNACQLTLIVSGRNGRSKIKTPTDTQLSLPNINIRPHGGRLLRKDYTFDHFVVGSNNDFAYTASLSMASRNNNQQNALFLLANTGMGKSHLSQAIGHHILSEYPNERVYYMTAEDFSNEMVRAYRHNDIDRFKGKYRNGCDVLLLEDLHYLSGKERTQVELAMTLDALLAANKKIIFSSCYLPTEIPKLNDKLRSRLINGLISKIEPPGFRTRVRILKKKSMLRGFKVPDAIVQYLAAELTDDVRQLESGLIGVIAKSSLLGVKIDQALAESVVKNIVAQRKSISIDVIKKLVCKYYGISLPEIVSRSRKQGIVRPRQMAMFLSRQYTDAPLQEIGRCFNRYHATALHAINAIEKKLKHNTAVQKQVHFFRHKLESGKF